MQPEIFEKIKTNGLRKTLSKNIAGIQVIFEEPSNRAHTEATSKFFQFSQDPTGKLKLDLKNSDLYSFNRAMVIATAKTEDGKKIFESIEDFETLFGDSGVCNSKILAEFIAGASAVAGGIDTEKN